MPAEPAYTRLAVDERRRQLIDAGAALFAEHAFEEISMRQIAQAAGVSKGLMYHYFPSKAEFFKAAVDEYTAELQRLIEPRSGDSALEQLAGSLDGYLTWIERNAAAWSKLMQSAASVPELREVLEVFRSRTMDSILAHLTGGAEPSPVLRMALRGWLGYIDASLLDWVEHRDVSREQLIALLIAAFGAALSAAQDADPEIELGIA